MDHTLKGEIDAIDLQFENLYKRKRELIFDLVRNCKHESIITSENDGRWPWRSTSHVTCIECGLRVNGDNCGIIHAPLLNLTQSRIVSLKPNEKIKCRLHFDIETVTALKYPRRFTSKRLRELMAQTPWTFEEVRMKDIGQNYSILTEPYATHEEWDSDTYVID